MSDDFTCEGCGLLGKRRRGHVAPEGWYFASFTLEGESHDPGDLLIVGACSEACRDALWTKMAEHRWDVIERRVDVPAELRRAAGLHKRRLRQEARRIREGAWPCDGASAGEAFADLLDKAAEDLTLETERRIASLAARPEDEAPRAPERPRNPRRGCPVHQGEIHGREAEELREGLERILAAECSDLDDLRKKLRRLLDAVSARDSLAHLESAEADRDLLQQVEEASCLLSSFTRWLTRPGATAAETRLLEHLRGETP